MARTFFHVLAKKGVCRRYLAAPPPRVWLITGLMILVFFTAGHAVFEIVYSKPLRELKRLEAPTDGNAGLFVFGSSLVFRALPDEKTLQEMLIRQGLGAGPVKILWRSAPDPGHFVELMRLAIARKPKWIVLEANMFGIKLRPSEGRTSRAEEAVIAIRDFFRVHRNRTLKVGFNLLSRLSDRWDTEIGIMPDGREFSWDKYEKMAAGFRLRKREDYPEWEGLFQEAKDKGVRVIMLQLPRSREAAAFLPENLEVEFENLMAEYERDCGVKNLPFPHNLEQKTYFLDAAHLNPEGKSFYTRWFLDQLGNLDRE